MIYQVPAANKFTYPRGSAHSRRLTEHCTWHWRWYRAGLRFAIAVAIIGGGMAWVQLR
jgi:hypothetical protein